MNKIFIIETVGISCVENTTLPVTRKPSLNSILERKHGDCVGLKNTHGGTWVNARHPC